MMRLVSLSTLCALFFLPSLAAQDCMLGLGGRDTDLIISVFQLNEEQISRLRQWEATLQTETDSLESRAAELLERHPQGSPDALQTLGAKYQEIREAMLEKARYYDRLLLSLFNDRQYQLYEQLCKEALRQPMAPAQPGGAVSGEGTPDR